jgi:hypothetical protein
VLAFIATYAIRAGLIDAKFADSGRHFVYCSNRAFGLPKPPKMRAQNLPSEALPPITLGIRPKALRTLPKKLHEDVFSIKWKAIAPPMPPLTKP